MTKQKNQSQIKASRVALPSPSFIFGFYAFLLTTYLPLPIYGSPPPPTQLPSGGKLIGGLATENQKGQVMTINQSSLRAAMTWSSFDIGSSSTVNIIQPNSSSVLLNQVLNSNPTQIFGHLNANGQVVITNPAGMYFSPTAAVSVGGLIATTNSISSEQFMSGLMSFSSDGTLSSVINDGNIQTALAGYVALMSPTVINNGIIIAQMGTVVLAAGNQYVLQFGGTSLNSIAVSPSHIAALVTNGNAVYAPGGLIILSAQANHQIRGGIVGNTGVLDATGITDNGGIVQLTATQTINAGGKILVDAESNSTGSGGLISVIADPNNPTSQTNVTGVISAKGGGLGGNGGTVETSANTVQIANTASVNTLAVKGLTGSWIIDPNDFTISNQVGADISPASLVSNLLSSNVTILSSNGQAGGLGDIQVGQPIAWDGATKLTLNAVHDVLVGNAITANTAGASLSIIAGHDIDINAAIVSVGALASISMNAGNNVNINAAITGTAANTNIAITAAQNVSSTSLIQTVAADSAISITGAGNVTLGGAITATAANTTISVSAGNDILTSAAISAVAASSKIALTASRDITTSTTAAISAGAATTQIVLNAGRNISINSAIDASAAGSSIALISGLAGGGPGIDSGTVTLFGAVTSPNLKIRFNPDSYLNTTVDIALYPALSDAKAWVYVGGNNKIYDGTSNASLGLKGTPSVGGNVTLVPGIATFDNKAVGNNKPVTFSNYSLGGLNSSLFSLFASNGQTTGNITPKAMTISALAVNKNYDGTTSEIVTLTDNRISGDTFNISYNSSTFSNPNAGIAKIVNITGITVLGTDAVNYSFNSSAQSTANINQVPLTLSASNVSKSYGQTTALTGFTEVGLVNNETIGSLVYASPGLAYNASVAGSPYPIIPSNASGGSFTPSNYSINYVSGLLTVKPIPLLVTVADAWKPYGTSMIPTAFTVNGLVNGDTVAAISESSPGAAQNASINGNPYTITPGTLGGGTFSPANYVITYVNGILTIVPSSN